MNGEEKRGDKMEKETFKGKRVIVTGGSRGIGAGIVRAFAGEGAEIAFLYHNADAAAEKVSRETGAIAVRCDLGDASDAERAMREALKALSGVDILVNNAGISKSGLIQDLSLDDWNRLVAVNLTAVYLCTRISVPEMVRQKYGRIVNISSIWGMVGASCEVGYSAVKAGVIGLTKGLARELGPSGITVNCVCPGVIDTDMCASYDEQTRRDLTEQTPVGRLGTPADIASTVLYLAGDGASFVTGQVLSPNGGFTVV